MKTLQRILFLALLNYDMGLQFLAYKNTSNTPKEEPVVIANDSLEYEIIIIDPGLLPI